MGLIRFILACGVVLSHTSTIEGYMPVNSDLAVQCFYIISGYYMAMILTEKYTGEGSTRLFYTNRALKIYPVYWLNLILLVLLSLVAFVKHYPGTFDFYIKYQQPSWWALVYLVIANLLLLGLDWVFLFGINKSGNLYFTRSFNDTNPNVYNYAFNSIAWTIGVELLFYVIAPWLNKQKWTALLTIGFFSLAIRLALAGYWGDFPPWNYMFFPTQLMFFIAGMLSYKCIDVKKLNWGSRSKAAVYILFVSVILCYCQVFNESYLSQTVLFSCVTLFTPFAFEVTKKSKFDRFFGNLSYPIYITQAFAIHITAIKRFPIILDRGLTTLIFVIALSILVNKTLSAYIERIRVDRVKRFKQA